MAFEITIFQKRRRNMAWHRISVLSPSKIWDLTPIVIKKSLKVFEFRIKKWVPGG